MVWNEPALFVLGLFAVTAIGCLLPIRIDEREDHIVLTIAAAVDGGLLGARSLVLIWGGVLIAVPLLLTWCLLPRNRERLGLRGARRKITFVGITAFAVTVGFVLANYVYVGLFAREYPVTVSTTANFALAGLVVFSSWVGTMSVRVISLGRRSRVLIREGLDPFDSMLIPYLLPLMAGFPLVAASVAMYNPIDPWPALLILWWCFPLYAATAFELHRRRLAQELRRDAFAKQRLAAIGEVSARIVHQSRHQVGLMGWSIHRLRGLAGQSSPDDVLAAQRELDALAQAKDRLSEMLASELLHEDTAAFSGAGREVSDGTDGQDEPDGSDDGAGGRRDRPAVTLDDVVAEVHEQLQAEADREGVVLEIVIDPSLGRRPAAGQLRDVVFNLVDNAIDAAASRVAVTLEAVDGTAVIRVCDDGAGLPDRDATRAFEPFYTTKSDGTGMGLAIADALVGDLGGDLRYERAGGMTSFVVTLAPEPTI
jgi:signal transduction histidine kinase